MNIYFIMGAAAAAVIAIAAAYGLGHSAGSDAAQTDFVKRIEKENHDAGQNAEKWRDDFRKCVAAGRVYDFETGACGS